MDQPEPEPDQDGEEGDWYPVGREDGRTGAHHVELEGPVVRALQETPPDSPPAVLEDCLPGLFQQKQPEEDGGAVRHYFPDCQGKVGQFSHVDWLE